MSGEPTCPLCGHVARYGQGPTPERRELVAAMRLATHARQAHGLTAQQFAATKRQESR